MEKKTVRNVLEYLDDIVLKCPEKTAFVDEKSEYSFRRLNEESRSVGSYLIEKNLYREPVAVFMEKSCEMITAFLGVLQAGCFYVPLDASMPEGRIRLILNHCKPRMLICGSEAMELAKASCKEEIEVVSFCEICHHAVAEERLVAVRKRILDIDPMYVVFTSGSTGTPKGVCACHRSVIDYVEQLSKVLGIDETTVFGNQAPLYFDACLKEIYPTLMFGAATYLIPRKLFMFPTALVAYLNENKINTICWVASALSMISSVGTFEECSPKYLRTVAFGSEVFPVKQFQIWRDNLKNTSFFNLYGPTEGTGMCCYYPVKRSFLEHERIPIGFPFDNTEILLLKEDDTPAVGEEMGEICIRGTCVTLGYYYNGEATRKSYVQNPLVSAYPELIYRTGDIGRRNAFGELEFISRKDFQIKHMGHRIELGEIEACASRLDGVALCACTYDEKCGKIKLWFAGQAHEERVMEGLRKYLPGYMLPNQLTQLPNMPMTPNGKIDRRQLENL